jgi:hypothetical protein
MRKPRNYEGGDGEELPPPPVMAVPEEEAPAADEEPLLSEKPASEKGPTIEEQMCCCCICRCQGEEDKHYSCCGCFPIKCGLLTIGILTILVTLALFVEVYWTLLNEYIHWWYVLVGTICLIPLVVASIFVMRFFTKDQKGSRTNMWVAMMLAIVSFTLLAVWNLIYFQWVYKYDFVYAGVDGFGYVQQPKKGFMVWSLFIGIVFDFIWAYFLCIATRYATCKDGAPEPIDYTGGMGDKMGNMADAV